MGKLKNARWERFCQEYAVDYNGTQAAIRAGYSKKAAAQQAAELLRREDVLQRIGRLQADQARRLAISQDRVVLELLAVYERCMKAEPVLVWDSDSHSYVESGEWQFDSRGALKALELIGRHLGMFAAKVELTGLAEEQSHLRELLEQRRERRERR